MANYISEEILCEAYTHFDIDLIDQPQKLAVLKADLTSFMEERAKFLLGDDVTVKVEFEHGSLKTRVTVIGVAATVIVNVVSSYGSFRQGIAQAANDAAVLAQSANLELIFRTKTEYCDRIRIEKRKGVLGRVDSLLSELDAMSSTFSASKLPGTVAAIKEFNSEIERLLSWDESAEKLFDKLGNLDTEACIAAGLLEELLKLPKAIPWAGELNAQSFRRTVAMSDPDRAGQIEAAAARYSAVVRELTKKMKSRVAANAPQRA